MRFNIIIDIPEETVINYQKWAKKYSDLLDKDNLEQFILDTVQDQTQWDVLKCELLDKKDLKILRDFFQTK
jgi:hypothetical protein